MKRVLAVALMLSLVAGAAIAKDYEVQKKSGDLTFDIRIDRNPPIVGDNKIEVLVKDASGKAVVDGKVMVEYIMPPMPGMAPMSYKADAGLKGDRYTAVLKLSMAGPWNLAVKLTRAGRIDTVKFTVDAK